MYTKVYKRFTIKLLNVSLLEIQKKPLKFGGGMFLLVTFKLFPDNYV